MRRASMFSPARSSRLPLWLAFLALALHVVHAPRAHAAWQPGAIPLSPAPTSVDQSYAADGLAIDGEGGAYVTWQFWNWYPDHSDAQVMLKAQRVNVYGNRPAPWTPDGSTIRSWNANSSFGTHDVEPIGLYPITGGGATLAAYDFAFIVENMSLFRLYEIAPNGTITPINIAYSSFGGYPVRNGADADGDGVGGAVMCAWQQTFGQPPNPAPPAPLFAQHVDATGAPLWPEDASANIPGVQLSPTLASDGLGHVAALSDGAGGGFFAWSDNRAGDPGDVYVQHLDASGTIAPGWPAGGLLVCGAPDTQAQPFMVHSAAGGVIVIWRDDREGPPRLYGHIVLANGTLAPGIPDGGRRLPSSADMDRFTSLAADGLGGCFVAREGTDVGNDQISHHLHRLDTVLQPAAGWPTEGIVLDTSPHVSSGPVALVPDGLGGTFVSFNRGPGAPLEGLYAQHFAPDGSVMPGWLAEGLLLSGTGHSPEMVRSGDGAVVTWNDSRGSYPGVYAQRLAPDGPVAVEISLVSALATGDRVALRWYAAGGFASRATIERSIDGAQWLALGEIAATGTGYLDYEDTAVEAGTRYGYRLAWDAGGSTRTSAATWIVVPQALALTLEMPTPNPSGGAVALAITLPDERAATLGVFDLLGRRVVTQDLAGLGAGRHVITLREASSLAPGLYVVQLTHAGVTRRARLVRVE